MRRRILRCLIWVSTVCLCPKNRMPGLYGLSLIWKTDIAIKSIVRISWNIWATVWQNQQDYLCAQGRLRSASTSTQIDQSSLCTQWIANDPRFLLADSEDSDQTGRTSFYWFCSVQAQTFYSLHAHLFNIWLLMLFWPVYRGSYMSVHVLLNILYKLGE